MTVSATTVTQYYTGIFRKAPAGAVSTAYQSMANDAAALSSMLGAANVTVDPVIRLYQTAFNRLPDNAGMTAWVTAYTAGAITLQQIANGFTQSTEFTTLYPSAMSNSQFVGALYWNILQRKGEDAGIAGWVDALNKGALTRAQVLLGFAESAEFKAKVEPAVDTFLTNIANTAVADQGTASLYAGTLFDLSPATIVPLTINEDILSGGASNDLFSAPIVTDGSGTQVATLQDFDQIDGGSGRDTLNATLNNDVDPNVASVEVINLKAVANVAVDLTAVAGAEEIWNALSTSSATITYTAAPIAATFGVRSTASDTDIDTFDDVSGTADELKLALVNAGTASNDAVVSSGADAGDIEALTIAASGLNFVDVADFDAVETLAITAEGTSTSALVDAAALTDITLSGGAELLLVDDSGNDFAVLVNLDASGSSNAIELDISGGTDLASVVTGSGDDVIGIDGTVLVTAAELEIDLGAGTNTLALTNIVDETALGDLVFTGDDLTVAGVSTLGLLDSITLTAAGTLDLDGISPSSVEFADDVDLGGENLALANTAASISLTFDGTLDDGTLDFGADATSGTIAVDGDVGAGAAVVIAGEALESLSATFAGDADIELGDTEAALETVVINASGDGAAIGALINGDTTDQEYSLTSLSLGDTSEDGDVAFVINLVDTVALGSIVLTGGSDTSIDIDASLANFDGSLTVDIGSFGTLNNGLVYDTDVTNGVREVFAFVGGDIGDVDIDGFVAGIGSSADRLDFSSFAGVSSAADLDITYDGTNTTITAADGEFAGTIIVQGVDLSTNTVNFIF
jgi:hypothetical protein